MIHSGASAQLMISLLLSWRRREPTWKDLRGVENALRLRVEAEALGMRRPAARWMKRSAGRVWTVAWVIRQPMNTPGWDRRWMYYFYTRAAATKRTIEKTAKRHISYQEQIPNYTERLANLRFCVRRHAMITQVGTSHYLHTSSHSGCEFCTPQKSHSGRKEGIEVRISAGISQSVELYIPFTPLLISFFSRPLQSSASNP